MWFKTAPSSALFSPSRLKYEWFVRFKTVSLSVVASYMILIVLSSVNLYVVEIVTFAGCPPSPSFFT